MIETQKLVVYGICDWLEGGMKELSGVTGIILDLDWPGVFVRWIHTFVKIQEIVNFLSILL